MPKHLSQKLAFLNLIDWLPYSRNFTETRPDFPEEIFTAFIFAERMCNALTTPYQLIATPTSEPKKRHWKMKQRSKLVQQLPSLPFVWRALFLQKYQDYHCGRKIAEGHSTANLDFDNFGASLQIRWYFVYWQSDSSLQKPKEGRETVENHLIHTPCTI